ncbi:MAG: PD40 domain-containing protein, partial [Bryobacterales bacterium]|nr:PD40 domain-containing protein [Bryobacterales bacterium]
MRQFLFLVVSVAVLFSADPPAWSPAYSMKFRNLGSVTPSPNGKWVAWTEREAVITEDKSEYLTQIFLARSDGSSRFQLTRGEKSSDSPQFSADNKYVYFASDRSGKRNVFRIATEGGEAEQLTDWKGTLASFAVSPDGWQLVFTGRAEDKEEEKRKKSKLDYRIVDDTPKNASLWIAGLD